MVNKRTDFDRTDFDKLYTPQELATTLSVERMSIYNWIRRGKLKAYKIGGVVRIKRSDVTEMMYEK
jgi:excisionase family DNA binding protein